MLGPTDAPIERQQINIESFIEFNRRARTKQMHFIIMIWTKSGNDEYTERLAK